MYIGQYFWSTSPSTESVDKTVAPPWRGVVTKEYTRIDGSISHVKLCRFDPETKFPDEDTNASAYVNIPHLYSSFEAARIAFLVDLREQLENLQEAIRRAETLKEGEWMPLW